MIKSTLSDAAIRKLSTHQRNLLIDHIDGEVDVVVSDPHKVQCRNALMALGLLRGSPTQAVRPRITVLTERGRMAVAMILGDYADALVRAGLLEQENPLLVLKRLKAARQPAPTVTMVNAARALAKLA
jgi:hypothetical protein